VPGLGKKTAQKMLLALKGKLNLAKESVSAGPYAELTDALVEMGYDKVKAAEALKQAEAAIDADGKSSGGAEREQELFKRAIVLLTGN
jgi:Holliday junction DNA helicase RuvA